MAYTAEELIQIKKLIDKGETCPALSIEYGYATQPVTRVDKNKFNGGTK